MSIDGLARNWTFVPSEPNLWLKWKRRSLRLMNRRSRPASSCIVAASARPCWVVYFVFLPTGQIESRHRFTLQALRAQGFPILVICATPEVSQVPGELRDLCDALYWKALSGYDFSAYRLALEAVAQCSPEARVLVFNDSVLGPFVDLAPFIQGAPWDFTGFTASRLNENHIQSYAFVFRSVTPRLLDELSIAIPADSAFDNVDAVIWCQETLLAREAHRYMSVGSYWYADGTVVDDACLRRPFELLEHGFPFMKRSLLGKMSGFQDRARVIQALQERRHPVT